MARLQVGCYLGAARRRQRGPRRAHASHNAAGQRLGGKWLLSSPPRDRAAKIGTVASVANILNRRLRPALAPAVARRKAEAFGRRSMLEMIHDDDRDELHSSIKASFDFASVA